MVACSSLNLQDYSRIRNPSLKTSIARNYIVDVSSKKYIAYNIFVSFSSQVGLA